ncbi:MAG TPA: prepilin-type N-terminal cleavage/methylation domain-containing protein [Terriglobia bacterium]|nr:prepilin-type N-terminal cleavage/methylation domain-containing protein [Terriglobia bacterium]
MTRAKQNLRRRACRAQHGERGFTLLELAMVMALIMVLAAITFPAYHTAIQRSKEAVLRDDLATLRKVVDEYTVDKQAPPQSLQDLVDSGYLHAVPVDPMTGTAETWQVDVQEVPVPPDQTATGVVDVHSGSAAEALDGTSYSAW